MTKTEFIAAATAQYKVTPDESFYTDIDLMADRSLSVHLGETSWAKVQVKDQHYLLLIMGSMIHYSRASNSAKTDFPLESQEGSVDKSARYRNNIGMALSLKREYIESQALSGAGIKISSIGRYDPIDIRIYPLDTVPLPEQAVITAVSADSNYIYVDWEDTMSDWGYRRTIIYFGEDDPYDPYEYTQLRSGTKAGVFLFDADIQKAKFEVPEPGTYIIRVVRENLNGVLSISNAFQITVDGTDTIGVEL